MSNIFKHLKTILTHKKWVFYYASKLGISWQGFWHDMSKFSPTEFFESIKYYKGTSSPIPECKKDKGYSLAWQHHKGRNKHHYEYWTDNYDTGTTCIKMPYKYVLELVADYLAAGKTYRGKYFSFTDEWDWWIMKRANYNPKIHPYTMDLITKIFRILASEGEKGFKYIKQNSKQIEREYESLGTN